VAATIPPRRGPTHPGSRNARLAPECLQIATACQGSTDMSHLVYPEISQGRAALVPGVTYRFADLFTFTWGNMNPSGASMTLPDIRSPGRVEVGGLGSGPPAGPGTDIYVGNIRGDNFHSSPGSNEGNFASVTVTLTRDYGTVPLSIGGWVGGWFGYFYLNPHDGNRTYLGGERYRFDFGVAAPLFTPGADTRDFNDLEPADLAALDAGASPYEALGGADTVTLPGLGKARLTATVTWDFDRVFYGGAGQDRIRGRNGNDRIDGGDGDDSLEGGLGNDTLWGGKGSDSLSGGPGDDVVYGGDGHDSVEGGSGNDILWGGDGDDSLFGGPDGDVLYGRNGNDVLYGGAGQDTIYGGEGDDYIDVGPLDGRERVGGHHLFGGDGKDTLVAGGADHAARNELTGGAGADQFVVLSGDLIHDMTAEDTILFRGGRTTDWMSAIRDDDGSVTLRFHNGSVNVISDLELGGDLAPRGLYATTNGPLSLIGYGTPVAATRPEVLSLGKAMLKALDELQAEILQDGFEFALEQFVGWFAEKMIAREAAYMPRLRAQFGDKGAEVLAAYMNGKSYEFGNFIVEASQGTASPRDFSDKLLLDGSVLLLKLATPKKAHIVIDLGVAGLTMGEKVFQRALDIMHDSITADLLYEADLAREDRSEIIVRSPDPPPTPPDLDGLW
jgi:hypothetical protein